MKETSESKELEGRRMSRANKERGSKWGVGVGGILGCGNWTWAGGRG